MRARPRRVLLAGLVLAALLPPAAHAGGLTPLPDRFEDHPVLEDLDSPTAVRFAPPPDGRIFVASKSGVVRAYDGAGDVTPAPVVDLSEEVHDFWDRGLLGMALDPGFATNRRLYLLYTRDARIGGAAPRWDDGCPDPPDGSGPGATDAGCDVSGALVRVTLDELGVAREVTPLIRDEWCQQYPSHSVGTVAFGPDGMLYAGAGDGADFTAPDYGQRPGKGEYPANPCGDPVRPAAPEWEGGALRSQDVRTAGDPTGLDGAIVRVDPATGEAAPGNPFAARGDDPGARRIVAYGLRNPFRFAFRPGTPELWIGDVGDYRWEEVDVAADATDGVAENFGWPCFEGAERHAGFAAVEGLRLCETLQAEEVTPPAIAYAHHHDPSAPPGCDGGAGTSISGVAFPAAGGYPEAYRGALFVSDYARRCIHVVRAGPDGRPDASTREVFAAGGPGQGGPVELLTGPGGELHYTILDPERPGEGALRRIAYAPGNRTPVAMLAAEPVAGPAPLPVRLSAEGSTDPDGDPLAFAWDLDGDGAFDDATGPVARRTYLEPRPVRAAVRAVDPAGAAGLARVTIAPGDAPRPAIEAPLAGARWSAGERIAFRGGATDVQDGPLAAAALRWTLTLDHCEEAGACHAHPIEQRDGVAEGTIVAPEHPFPTRLVLTLVATDSGGLMGETTVRLDMRPPVPAPAPALAATAEPAPAAGAEPAPAGGVAAAAAAQRPAPPRVRLSVPARRVGARLPLVVRCSRPCAVRVRATPLAGRRALRAVRAGRPALARRARLELRLPAAARRALHGALRRGAAARLRVAVTARDAAGRRGTARRTVALRRR